MHKSIWVGVAVLAAACGGSVTTVDGSKNTNSLSPTDQNQLCTDTYNYALNAISAGDVAKLACGFTVANGTDPSTCQQSYTTCLAQQKTTLPTGTPDCTAFAQSIAKCNTTVAQYTDCMKQEIDALKAMESQFPLCTQAEQQNAEVTALSKMSAQCIALMQTCNVAFVSIGASSSSGGTDGG